MTRGRWLALALIPVALAWTAAGRFEPSRVAVVDLSRLIRENRYFLAEQEAVREWQDQMQGMLDETQKQLAGMEADLDQYQPGTDEHKSGREALQVAALKLKMREESLTGELKQRLRDALANSHQRAVQACSQFRIDQGLDLVVQHNPQPLGNADPQELVGEIVLRKVVTFDPQLDITEDVLTILNG